MRDVNDQTSDEVLLALRGVLVERAGLVHGSVPERISWHEGAYQYPRPGDVLDLPDPGSALVFDIPNARGRCGVIVHNVGAEQPGRVDVGILDEVHHLVK